MGKLLPCLALVLCVSCVYGRSIGRPDLIKRWTDDSVKIQCINLDDYRIQFWKSAKMAVSVDGNTFYNYSYFDSRPNPEVLCNRCRIEQRSINLKKMAGFSVDLETDKTFLVLRNFMSDFYGLFSCRAFYEFTIAGQESSVTVENEQDGELNQNVTAVKTPRTPK